MVKNPPANPALSPEIWQQFTQPTATHASNTFLYRVPFIHFDKGQILSPCFNIIYFLIPRDTANFFMYSYQLFFWSFCKLSSMHFFFFPTDYLSSVLGFLESLRMHNFIFIIFTLIVFINFMSFSSGIG